MNISSDCAMHVSYNLYLDTKHKYFDIPLIMYEKLTVRVMQIKYNESLCTFAATLFLLNKG